MTQTLKKTCFKCGVPQPLTSFYKHPQMADGRLNKCKGCTKKDVQTNYKYNVDHYRAYEQERSSLPHRVEARKEYAATEAGREAGSLAKKRWEERNPEKKKASTTLNNAIRDGKIQRGTRCAICGSRENIEAHHEDYRKPLEVIWLCKRDHWKADKHRRQRETFQILKPRTLPTSSSFDILRPMC
jgi:hypothetical protein